MSDEGRLSLVVDWKERCVRVLCMLSLWVQSLYDRSHHFDYIVSPGLIRSLVLISVHWYPSLCAFCCVIRQCSPPHHSSVSFRSFFLLFAPPDSSRHIRFMHDIHTHPVLREWKWGDAALFDRLLPLLAVDVIIENEYSVCLMYYRCCCHELRAD